MAEDHYQSCVVDIYADTVCHRTAVSLPKLRRISFQVATWQPVWAPNSWFVIFHRPCEGEQKLYIVHAATGQEVAAVSLHAYGFSRAAESLQVQWSLDSASIVMYVQHLGRNDRVHIVDFAPAEAQYYAGSLSLGTL